MQRRRFSWLGWAQPGVSFGVLLLFLITSTADARPVIGPQDREPSRPASQPTTAPHVAESSPAEPIATLRVLDLEGKPAAGAIVDFADASMQDLMSDVGPDYFTTHDRPDRIRAIGLVANTRGEVRLPRFKLGAFVRARLGRLAEEDLLAARWVSWTYELRLRKAVEVLVVDAAGIPQPNVPVVLGKLFDFGFGSKHSGLTDVEGVARIAPPKLPAKRPRVPIAPATWQATLALPLAEPVTAAVDAATPPTTPAKLLLPPTGRLTIRFVGDDGKPFLGTAFVRIRKRMATSADDHYYLGDAGVVATELEAADGVAEFAMVGVGTTLFATVRFADPALRAMETVIDGPQAAGAHVTADLRCGGRCLRVTGRLVERAGRPGVFSQVNGQILVSAPVLPDGPDHAPNPFLAHSWSNEAGRFTLRFEVDPRSVDATSVRLWPGLDLPANPLDEESKPTIPRGVDFRLANTASGLVDVGDVVLQS